MSIFSKLFNTTPPKRVPYECHNDYRPAGTTFKNEDGTSRQDIIKKLKDNDPLELKKYIFDGKVAIGIYTKDGIQIGNVKEKEIPFVEDRMRTMTKCIAFDVRSFIPFDSDKEIYTFKYIVFYMH